MTKSLLTTLLLAGAALTAAAQNSPRAQPLGPASAWAEVLATQPRPRAAATSRLVQRLEQTYYRGAWADTVRYSYARFTPANNAGVQLRAEASPKAGTPFHNAQLIRSTFNAAEQATLDTTYNYSVSGVWNAARSQVHAYNAQGQLAQTVEQIWATSGWRDANRYTYAYTATGQLASRLWEVKNGSNWGNQAKIIWTYDAQGRLTQYEYLYAPPASTTFEPSTKILFAYDANGQRLTELYQYYRLGTYTDYVRETFRYNAAGQLQSDLVELPQGNNVWQPDQVLQYSYDAAGNQTQVLQQAYVVATNTFTDYYRTLYTYERVTAAAPARALAAGLTAVPNPSAQGVAELRFQLPAAAAATVQVLDLTGRVLATRPLAATAAAQRLELAPLGLRAGLYLVRLTAAGLSQQTRLVVQ